MRTRHAMRQLGLALVTLVLASATAGAQTVVRPGFNIFTVAQDVQIGRQSASQVERQLPMMNDGATQRYVSALGARLAAQAPGPKFSYQFKVANLSDINAFALPGGFVYVNRGLLEQVRTEGELAGVMAHEITHVALRHPTNQASKAYLANAGLGVLGGLLGGKSGTSTGGLVKAVGGFGMNALFLKFSRSVESQADIAGAQIMDRAGYDPMEMAHFFELLRQKAGSDPGKVAVFMSDHPAPIDREARVAQEAKLLGAVTQRAPIGGLASVQGRLRGFPAARTSAQVAANPQTPADGATANGAGLSIEAPSTRYVSFRQAQGHFRVDRPDNWTISTATGGYGITLLPRRGLVSDAGGRNSIACGVILSHYVPFDGTIAGSAPDPRTSSFGVSPLELATSDLVQQVEQSNPQLHRVAGSEQRTTLSGRPSLSVRLTGQSGTTGRTEQVTVLTRELADDHIVYLLFIAPGDEFAALDPTFNHIAQSLQIDERAPHN
ncbi:MAG: M48 family metallopeptidase [Candidatus Eisenbacteria bacterium]